MTIEELYAAIGADYDDVRKRLPSDDLVARFVGRFAEDESCANLVAAWAAGDEQAAFEAAHTAKGVCANLGLSKLASLASDVTEALRPGNDELRATTDVAALVQQLASAHEATVAAINDYAASE
ncbi:MAG: Hpt domain-containing protein [Eggerthellaceae bacterium]|nr:Hpt domain-containing protein [Eggerthellaceae bacterium]